MTFKMVKRSNHVIPVKSSGWAVKKTGASRATRKFDLKDKAIEYAIKLSKKEKTELYIHKRNGMVQNMNSYGKDPHPPRDFK